MKKLILTSLFLVTGVVHAGSFDAFFYGFEREYFLNPITRPRTLSDSVSVSKFSKLAQILNPSAVATYNDKLNIVSLDEKLLNEDGIKDSRVISGKDFRYDQIATIFHEIGHAELDVFIEEKVDISDVSIMSFYDSELKNFYKRYFPDFNPKAVLHEHFGYYRTNLVEFFANEISDIYMNNGFNRFKKSCFLNPMLKKKLAEGISLVDFQQIFEIEPGKDFYRKSVAPDYVFVKGKDLHLKAAHIPQGPLNRIHTHFWSYHQDHYGFPINQKILVNRMNLRSPFKNALSECRSKLWKQNHRISRF